MTKGLKYRALFTALAGLLYGASPLDIIPDVIPLLGWVDDAVIVPTLLMLALLHYRRAKKAEASPVAGHIIDLPPARPRRTA